MSADKDYKLEELRFIRVRISEISQDINVMEYYYFFTIGCIYYFLFSDKEISGPELYILMLPTLICLYGFFRYQAMRASIKKHEEYVIGFIENDELKFTHFYYGVDDAKINLAEKITNIKDPAHIGFRFMYWLVAALLAFILFVYVLLNSVDGKFTL